MSDFLFRGNLAKLDPDVYELTQLEAERQARKLILIPSESQAPLAVREAHGLRLPEHLRRRLPRRRDALRCPKRRSSIIPARLAHYRRNGDPRYYKGVEYADVVEVAGPPPRRRGLCRQRHQRRPDLRQRAGALGRARQQRRLPGAGQPGRHRHGH